MVPKNASLVPQPLPPSVEEAYRRKCCQLRHRTNEIEESNDASRLRLTRLRRQIEKLRVERVLLLDQLAKRTSTNVEDSEGSPSPPPTPKEKPLRIKRGHRKHSLLADSEKPTGDANGGSPVSESFSHPPEREAPTKSSRANGIPKLKRPANAFEIYCNSKRPSLTAKMHTKPGGRAEEELARGWKDLPEEEKERYQQRYEKELARYQKQKSKGKGAKGGKHAAQKADDTEPEQEAEQDMDQDTGHGVERRAEAEPETQEPEAEPEAEQEVEAGADAAAPVDRPDDDVEMADDTEDPDIQARAEG